MPHIVDYSPLCYARPSEKKRIIGALEALRLQQQDFVGSWPVVAAEFTAARDSWQNGTRTGDCSSKDAADLGQAYALQIQASYRELHGFVRAYHEQMGQLKRSMAELDEKYASDIVRGSNHLCISCREEDRSTVNTAYDILDQMVHSPLFTRADILTRELSTLQKLVEPYPNQCVDYYNAIRRMDDLEARAQEMQQYQVDTTPIQRQKEELSRHFNKLEQAVQTTRKAMITQIPALNQLVIETIQHLHQLTPIVLESLQPASAQQLR